MRKDQRKYEEEEFAYEEAFRQQIEVGEEIPNQWSLKLKKVESILIPDHMRPENSQEKCTVDIKRSVILKKDGKASITFDVSRLQKYSIAVINESEHSIAFKVEISPDQFHYATQSDFQEVGANRMGYVHSEEYMKYTRVQVKGTHISTAIIILQGIR
ncbi:DUF6385 domain-containing protein [Bacillus testis]|uniref:DUF6385 domain-containing protein n=1 Tax=Bacillus testis TaxID=1622072 RepID=UPI00067F49AD|nr:DUF6385 domain-containing protein [Bacillus testis]